MLHRDKTCIGQGQSHSPIPILTGKKASLSSGATLFAQGAQSSFVYLIQQGRVVLSVSDGRQEYVVRIAGPGTVVGAAEVLAGENHPCTAVTLDSTQVVQISRKNLLEQLKRSPKSWDCVLKSISSEVLAVWRLNVNARLHAASPIQTV